MNARCVNCQHSNSQHANGAVCSVPMRHGDRIGTNLCDCPRYETADQRHERVTERMVGAFRALNEYQEAVARLLDVIERHGFAMPKDVRFATEQVDEARERLDGHS